LLQVLPTAQAPAPILAEVNSLIRKIFLETEVTKHVNKNNSDHSILFEAMRLGLSLGEAASTQNIKESI
jgi:hypothetical protein